MNTKETALIASMATVLCLVVCQLLTRAAAHPVQLSSAQVMSGLAICLAGVAVGLLIVLCASAFQASGSGLDRSLGAVGLALGCALLLALLMGHRSARAQSASQSVQEPAAVTNRTVLLAPGAWR